MIKKTILFSVLCFCIAHPSFAQSQPSPEEQMRAYQEELIRMEEEFLEELKRRDPKAYRERIRIKKLTEQINAIAGSFRRGEISESSARNRLSPLVREFIAGRIEALDQEIARFEERLSFLKKAKANPDLLVQQEVDRYLGKSTQAEGYLSF